MCSRVDRCYIVCIEERDNRQTFNEYETAEEARACIMEAITDDGVDPGDVTVYRGRKLAVDIGIGKVTVNFPKEIECQI